MHEAAYALAASPRLWNVLTWTLKPYSIGHALLLHAEQSPFVIKAGKPGRKDLIRAVLICAHSAAEFERMDRLLKVKMVLWRWRIRKVVGVRLTLAMADFAGYLDAGTSEPPAEEVTSSGQPQRLPGAPFLLRLEQFLIRKMAVPRSQVRDFPYACAVWNYAAYFEAENGIKIKNEHDAEFERYVAKQEAELAAKAK